MRKPSRTVPSDFSASPKALSQHPKLNTCLLAHALKTLALNAIGERVRAITGSKAAFVDDFAKPTGRRWFVRSQILWRGRCMPTSPP